ncbi:GntR family transcriptional regulator [Mycetocola sp. 2940]|uniref:GntR family transcriptional regulator n=1 Tax=Mycetocola sp. 2940 TaxID=3156452 RepID=UPI0033908C83
MTTTRPRNAIASQRIADELRVAILDGSLVPGERILQEELAAQYNASRLPVREAIRILEAEGLVSIVANSGAWVSKLDLDECVQIYKIRERIEPLALAESVPRLGTRQLEELSELVDAMAAGTDVENFLVLDRQFHLLTYSESRMVSLNQLIERLWNTTQPYRRAFSIALGSERNWMIHAEHKLLMEAIKRRDVDEAERTVLGHIRRTRIELEGRSDLFR